MVHRVADQRLNLCIVDGGRIVECVDGAPQLDSVDEGDGGESFGLLGDGIVGGCGC